MTTLVIATRNPHKVREIRAFLPDSLRLLALSDFPGAPAVVEDAGTFAGNATKKAVGLAHWLPSARSDLVLPSQVGASRTFALADDSGLAVDALQGQPGVHSARFAALEQGQAGNSSDASNNEKLLSLLEGVPPEKRTARFLCCIALTPVADATVRAASPVCAADEAELATELFEGVCEGRIHQHPRGTNGFGYDPLFVPSGFEQSFAELGQDTKNQISHRARALAKLREWLGRAC